MKNKKEITVTFDELAEAHAKAITSMTLRNPALILMSDELTTLAAITAHILFDKEKED